MKKEYIKPTMQLVRIQRMCLICASGDRRVTSVYNSSNDGISMDGAGYDDDDYDM